MATQLEKPKSRTATSATSKMDGYVASQLRKTTQQVRVSDIATGFLTLASFVLAFLLVVAIVDAWIWPLSPAARVLALVSLLAGSALIAWFQLIPYFFKKINPQFAAKMIEEAKPDFKNSLLNYLSLKKNRTDKKLHRAILGEVSKKAATDLSTISPDAAVDKSNLIRIGFILVGLVAILISYSILSPKNPLPTFMRVLAPNSKISQPAAVTIQVVTPQDADVFFGDKPIVTAEIKGVTEADEVRLVYTTNDSQIVDAYLTMEYSGTGSSYSATLETSPIGIQQSLTYHVEAGDGVSPEYAINVRPNPSITVNSIQITPPKYTGLPERIIEGQGEIQAVEGSRVEIIATANLPIELAYIVPLLVKNESAVEKQYRELRTIQMKSENQQAIGHMTIGLNSNRDRALFSHYKINFRSKDDFKNERPNIYPIRVIADLAPEIEIVAPALKEVTVPVNQPLPVEIWASDLDYELSSIDLFVDHDGHQVLDKNLFKARKDKSAGSRIQTRSTITPQELRLKPGDKAILYAVASDNRISMSSDLPDPNTTRSDNYTLIITAPIEQENKSSDQSNDSGSDDSQQESEAGSSQEGNSGDQGDSSGDQENSQDSGDPSSDDQGESGGDQTGENQDTRSESGDTEQESQGSQESDQPSDSDAEKSKSEGNGSTQSPSAETEDSKSDDSESEDKNGNGDRRSEPSDSDTNPQSRDGSEGEMTDAPDQDSADGTAKNAGGSDQGSTEQRGRQGNQDKENSSGQANGEEFRDENLQDGEQQEPLSEDAHPGEKFERLKDYFDKQNDQKDSQENNPQKSQDSDENSDNQRQPESGSGSQDSGKGRPSQSTENSDSPENSGASDQGNAEAAGNREDEPSEDSDARGGNDPRERNEDSQSENSENPNPKSNQSAAQNQTPEHGSSEPTETENSSNTQAESDQKNTSSEPSESSDPTNSSEPEKPQQEKQASKSNENSPNSDEPSGGGSDDASKIENSESEKSNDQPSQNSGKKQQGNSNESSEKESQSQENSNGEPSSDLQNSGSQNEQNDSSSSKDKQSGGSAGNKTGPTNPQDGPVQKDDPNLDYTKKVTDLVLDQLENQKYDPDQELLEQMNWTQQDLDHFLKQWKQMKANAESGNAAAKREYKEQLKSLGITPKTKSRKAVVEKEKEFRLNENGAVDRVPREYLEKFNSFLRRRNRSKRR